MARSPRSLLQTDRQEQNRQVIAAIDSFSVSSDKYCKSLIDNGLRLNREVQPTGTECARTHVPSRVFSGGDRAPRLDKAIGLGV